MLHHHKALDDDKHSEIHACNTLIQIALSLFSFILNRQGIKFSRIEAAERLLPIKDSEVDAVSRRVYGRDGLACLHRGCLRLD